MANETMTCPICGTESAGNVGFCFKCGKGFSGKYLEAEGEAQRMSARGWGKQGPVSGTKKCPFCAEDVQAAAVVC
jgi:hypothetical protein